MRLNPETLAKASSHHPWRTLTVWLVVLVLAGVSSALLLSGGLTTNFDFTNNPEAKQAKTIVDDAFPGAKAIHETWVVTTDGSVNDAAFAQTMNTILTKINALGATVVTAAPASYPPTAAALKDPVTAALGPIPRRTRTRCCSPWSSRGTTTRRPTTSISSPRSATP